MPDDRHIDARQLYERDYYAWAVRQAKLLHQLARSGEESLLDLENLAEEVADLGISQKNALHSYIQNAIEHLLKLEYSQARDPRAGWSVDLVKARLGAAKSITPTLQRKLLRSCRKFIAVRARSRRRALPCTARKSLSRPTALTSSTTFSTRSGSQ